MIQNYARLGQRLLLLVGPAEHKWILFSEYVDLPLAKNPIRIIIPADCGCISVPGTSSVFATRFIARFLSSNLNSSQAGNNASCGSSWRRFALQGWSRCNSYKILAGVKYPSTVFSLFRLLDLSKHILFRSIIAGTSRLLSRLVLDISSKRNESYDPSDKAQNCPRHRFLRGK
jgi:hypothetical protein